MARYESPRITDYGDLRELTAADFGFLAAGPEGGSALVDISPPITPPPDITPPDITPPDIDIGGPPPDIDIPTGAPPTIAQVPGGGGAPAGGAPGGGGAAGGGGAGGGGELPVTGFPAALVGAVGSGLTAMGIALRKLAGRR